MGAIKLRFYIHVKALMPTELISTTFPQQIFRFVGSFGRIYREENTKVNTSVKVNFKKEFVRSFPIILNTRLVSLTTVFD